MKKALFLLFAVLCGLAQAATVERWGSTDIDLKGPAGGNPFLEVELSATFRQGARTLQVPGFYDGDGQYKVRFMPDSVGVWEYETHSNRAALDGKKGSITAVAPSAGNHGPVRVKNTWHFAYEDGTPYWQVGTTSYAWTHQTEALEQQTLHTLAAAPFNKMRMGVFPKRYEYNKNEPRLYAFEGQPPKGWDFSRFNPAFFRHLEQRVGQLRDLGIEADLILFHPYDKGHWGFDSMPPQVNQRYLRYVLARLAAYRNVWWSMANEFDFVKSKSMEEWDSYFQTVQAQDPYQHLRSIHNAFVFYNHSKPWVTHVSVQSGALTEDFERAVLLRDVYNKPVVYDEVKYEGDFKQRWGQLTPEEMVLRFWQGAIAGTYVGHSETYRDPQEIAWWSKGGVLRGQSPQRLAFFRKILGESPAEGLEPIDKWQDYPFAGKHAQYYLGYFGTKKPESWPFVLFKTGLQDGMKFRAEVIDTWNMTVTPVDGVFEIAKRDDYTFADKQGRSIKLPGRPYMALRITRIPSGTAQAACAGGASWCSGSAQRVQAGNAAQLVAARETQDSTHGAHFIEARMRPMQHGGKGFVIAGYTDERNWLGFGLELTPASNRLALVVARMEDGKLRYLKRVGRELDPEGSFYTLRLDRDGKLLTLHVNGQRTIGMEEPSMPAPRVGVLSLDGGFEMDGLRSGGMQVAPVSIGLARRGLLLGLQSGGAVQRYPVRTSSRDGISTAGFLAKSSDPAVASVKIDGDMVAVKPGKAGKAAITLTSVQDPNVALTLSASVAPAFAGSRQNYALQGRVQPAAGAKDAHVDSVLQLHFDAAPELGAAGTVRVWRAADNTLSDEVHVNHEVNAIGAAPDGFQRVVRWQPIQLRGSLATIRLHDDKLAYGTEYYVTVDGNLFKGASFGGKRFDGVGKAAGWRFRTRAAAPSGNTVSVDDDGPADFRTVQGALNHLMRKAGRGQPVTIRIANGRYEELLYLRGKDNVTLKGESRGGVVIAAENNDGLNPGSGVGQPPLAPGATGGRALFLVEDADLLQLDTLTIFNTTWNVKTIGGQAEALNFASEGRLIAAHSNFISEQDTIQVKGYSWFYQSLIAGTVDFIWGYNRAALFEECEIRSLGNSKGSELGGYVMQARTVGENDPGFVFLNSRFTHGPGPAGNAVRPGSIYLARPGVPTAWDKVSYINSSIGNHIAPVGWNGQPRAGTGWFEFNSMDPEGKALDVSARKGGRVIGAAEAEPFASRSRVFAQFDGGKGWNPDKEKSSP
jgi:pectin methylesterase-like acyl-CoA thioesterase